MPVLLRLPYSAYDDQHLVYDLGKRLTDVAITLCLTPVLLLLGIVCAYLIKMDSPGRIIFKQWRTGLNGKPFVIYKFRSMYDDQCHAHGGLQIAKGDKRLTRVGRYMRRYSIDELPQFWNILKGDMSLVGPRPHAVDHHNHYIAHIPNYERRLDVLPGMTGLAQVMGCRGATRDMTAMQNRFDHDIDYITKRSYCGDLQILVQTISRRAWRCPDMTS